MLQGDTEQTAELIMEQKVNSFVVEEPGSVKIPGRVIHGLINDK